MPSRDWPISRAAAVAAVMLAAATGTAPAQQRVGVNSAVNPEAVGTLPGAAARRLVIGDSVVFNERIATTQAGQTQILFLDQSAMTIGPNSDLVIDQFVYDPNTGTGKLAMSTAKGVLRFVGGKLSKQDDAVTLRTPAATIAVRGGVFLAEVFGNGAIDVTFLFGKGLTVAGAGGVAQSIWRPGFHVTAAPGKPPTPPAPAPPGAIASLLARLDGRAGGRGGAPETPTDDTVAASGIDRTISGNLNASLLAAALNQARPQPAAINIGALQSKFQVNTIQGQGDPTLQGIYRNPPPPGTPIGPSTQPPSAVIIGYAGHAKSTNGHGTLFGFSDQGPDGSIPYSGGTLTFPAGSPQQGIFTAVLGDGAGTLSFPLVPGKASFGPIATSSAFGSFTGISYLAPDNSFFFANLTPTGAPSERFFIYGGQPVNPGFFQATGATRLFAFDVQPDAALGSSLPFVRNAAGGSLPNATLSPYYVVAPAGVAFGNTSTDARTTTLQASLALTGQGANQQSVIVVHLGEFFMASDGGIALTGGVRGSSRLSASGVPLRIGSGVATVIDGLGNRIYGIDSISGFVLDQNAYTPGGNYLPNQFATETTGLGGPTNYGFTNPVIPGTLPAGAGASRTTQTLSGFFGGIQQQPAGGAYVLSGNASIATNAGTNRLAAIFSGGDPFTGDISRVQGLTLNFGSLTGLSAGRSAFVDDSRFAALESPFFFGAGTAPATMAGRVLTWNGDPGAAAQLYLVSAGTGPPAALLPPGLSFCECQFLQWGAWGGIFRDGTDGAPNFADSGHINLWIAGQPTVNMPTTGTGSYSGTALGTVFNNGANYLSAGTFTNSFDFGARTGTFRLSNFDRANLSGMVTASGNSYTGAISGLGPNGLQLSGNASGMFYGPLAAETGGMFGFHGLNYLASGIFAGRR